MTSAPTSRPSILFVSKPVAPPWNDSSKNLVKDLARAGVGFEVHLLTPRDAPLTGAAAGRAVSHGVYAGSGDHSPAIAQNLRVLWHLAAGARAPLWHFFFAPNPRSSAIARTLVRLRRRRAVQTICSRPRSFAGVARLLFGDQVVALSRATRDALLAEGVAPHRVRHIPPGITLPSPRDDRQRRDTRGRYGVPAEHALLLYPGDYQFSSAADTVLRAFVALDRASSPAGCAATLVMACRIKQAASRAEEARLQRVAREAGVAARVRFVNEVPDILDLVAASDLCLLPAESLYAKMDLPLVLIEALAFGVPIVVGAATPSVELLDPLDPSDRDGVAPGVAVPPRDAHALARCIGELLDAAERRRRMGAAARGIATRRYGIDDVARRHESLYHELLQPERGR